MLQEMEDERDGSQWWAVSYQIKPRHPRKKPVTITHQPERDRQSAILVAISEATLISEIYGA
jgi:hypothetical protein